METYLLVLIKAALAAGRAILEVYRSDFEVQHKADDSPLTLADRRSHEIIVSALAAFDLPVLSEEGRDIPFSERRDWQAFWLVDPLDGTKEFVKRNGEFTVNIALIERRRPVLGVIYVPDHDTLFFGTAETGAWRVDKVLDSGVPHSLRVDSMTGVLSPAVKLPCEEQRPVVYTIIGSRSHKGPALDAFIEEMRRKHSTVNYISAGSSLKLCRVAEGAADIYPRLGPTMEWDTAAGQAIAESAGATVLQYDMPTPLFYNKENLLNPWFVVRSLGRQVS